MVLQKIMSIILNHFPFYYFNIWHSCWKHIIWGRTSLVYFWFAFVKQVQYTLSFVFFFEFFCYLYVEFCIFLVGAQTYIRDSMPGVQSVAVVGQINLAHQPPTVSQVLTTESISKFSSFNLNFHHIMLILLMQSLIFQHHLYFHYIELYSWQMSNTNLWYRICLHLLPTPTSCIAHKFYKHTYIQQVQQ